jgi:pimeloyl-ACP methyl ester carboxylesterase
MPRVTNDGIAIHYRVEGDGVPLILQHGFTDSSESWYELGYVDALKSKYRLILPDTRGHGLSDKPHDPLAYTPANFAADIAAMLDDIGIQKTYYWGYSQGGWIAFAIARHTANRVSGFVIGGASASAASAYPTEPGKEDPLLTALRRGPSELMKLYGKWVTPALEKRLLANDTTALIACRQQRLIAQGYADIADKIDVPTLIYAGSADPIHDVARQSASQIPGAEFISLSGLTHIEAMCQTDFILPRVQQFLEKAQMLVVAGQIRTDR